MRSINNDPSPGNLVRLTWLNYYNDRLREQRIITEEAWRNMRQLILARYGTRGT